jgi:uncharacterized metal-binding protein YceD (DUF177 family)
MTDPIAPESLQADDALPSLWVSEDEARSPVRVSLKLDEVELAALASRCGLHGVKDFSLKAIATRIKGGRLRVEGRYASSFTYLCGVTLQPFESHIEEEFHQIFVDPARIKSTNATIDVDPLSEDDPDLLVNGAADVADLAFQLFALALDPYPRHPDATQTLLETGSKIGDKPDAHNDETPPSPFAVLKDLKPH